MTVDTTSTAADANRLGDAAQLLLDTFGPQVEVEYLPGKTSFRDELYARWNLSLLEAEELCDSLERAGLISYREPHTEDEETSGWVITSGNNREAPLS